MAILKLPYFQRKMLKIANPSLKILHCFCTNKCNHTCHTVLFSDTYLQRNDVPLNQLFKINTHACAVYCTLKIKKKKLSREKILQTAFGEWPKMWESCLLLMLFFHPLLSALRLHFPWVMTDIATHLSSSCLCPNRTSLLFYLIRFRGPARVGSFRLFKEVIFLISQASEELKITKWKSEMQS